MLIVDTITNFSVVEIIGPLDEHHTVTNCIVLEIILTTCIGLLIHSMNIMKVAFASWILFLVPDLAWGDVQTKGRFFNLPQWGNEHMTTGPAEMARSRIFSSPWAYQACAASNYNL